MEGREGTSEAASPRTEGESDGGRRRRRRSCNRWEENSAGKPAAGGQKDGNEEKERRTVMERVGRVIRADNGVRRWGEGWGG